MRLKIYNHCAFSVIVAKSTKAMAEVGGGGGIKSLQSFAKDRLGQSRKYTREISIGGVSNAG